MEQAETGTGQATFENIATGESIVDIGMTESMLGGEATPESVVQQAKIYSDTNGVPLRTRVDGKVYDFTPAETPSTPAEANGEVNSVIDLYSDRDLRVAVVGESPNGTPTAEWSSLDRSLLEEMAGKAESAAHLGWMIRTNLQEAATERGVTIKANLNGIDSETFKPGGQLLEWR